MKERVLQPEGMGSAEARSKNRLGLSEAEKGSQRGSLGGNEGRGRK